MERFEESVVRELPGDRYEPVEACELFDEAKSSLKEVGGLGLVVCIF